MKRRIMNQMEAVAIQLAYKSVGKSVPWYMYKVQKPKSLEGMLKEMHKESLEDKSLKFF